MIMCGTNPRKNGKNGLKLLMNTLLTTECHIQKLWSQPLILSECNISRGCFWLTNSMLCAQDQLVQERLPILDSCLLPWCLKNINIFQLPSLPRHLQIRLKRLLMRNSRREEKVYMVLLLVRDSSFSSMIWTCLKKRHMEPNLLLKF